MKNKKLFVLSILALLLYGAIFITDYIRCSSLKEPVFVIGKNIMADDEGPGVYQGLGYMVELEKYIDAEYGVCIRSIEMKMFGQVITASITDGQMVQEETISQIEEDTLQEELIFSTGETTQKQIFLNPKEMTVEI